MLNTKIKNIVRNSKIADIFNKPAKLKFSDINKFYSIPKKEKFKIGIEYERLSLDKDTLKTAKYENVARIIEQFASIYNWELIYDDKCIIGAKGQNGTSLSLEPGMQLEISLVPYEYIDEIQDYLLKIINILDNIAKAYNVIFVGYGINPTEDIEDIKILNKKRYLIMDKYLPYAYMGELSQKMMRKTAGIQINIDYFNNFDLYNKLELANKITPFVQALFSNSPFENNQYQDYKSTRANIWRYTGAQRCNCFYKNMFNNPMSKFNPIKQYIKEILKVPMIYIEKCDENILINGKINFLEYMKNGYFNFYPDIDDYILHQSLCFPDVRLKNYIEIRNHDSSNIDIVMALCAFYKGIFNQNIEKIKHKFDKIKLSKIDKYAALAAKYGSDFQVDRKTSAWDIIKELYEIARVNLNSNERAYLNPIEKMINSKKTQADIIIEKNIQNPHELINLLNNINEIK